MNQPHPSTKPRILVAPLDWGLGHATRCVPIIQHFLQRGCEVILAGEGSVAALLGAEFPQLLFLPLAGYHVQYGATPWGVVSRIVQQLPKIANAIKAEQAWLQNVVRMHNINVVISDNRYGLYHPAVHTVFITHQLHIKTPFGKWADSAVQKLAYRYINRFKECWVPDVEGEPNLGGALSHPQVTLSVPLTYIGPLSRFRPGAAPLTHYLLVLLSGPEPQRTLLEQKLLDAIKEWQQPVLFVRGLPGNIGLPKVPYHVTIVNHLSTNAMQKALEQAQVVICRSGYSTVMELALLQKKSIVIPTPGQTEQLYLAKHLVQQGMVLSVPQHQLSFADVVAQAQNFPYRFPTLESENLLEKAVDALLQKIAPRP